MNILQLNESKIECMKHILFVDPLFCIKNKSVWYQLLEIITEEKEYVFNLTNDNGALINMIIAKTFHSDGIFEIIKNYKEVYIKTSDFGFDGLVVESGLVGIITFNNIAVTNDIIAFDENNDYYVYVNNTNNIIQSIELQSYDEGDLLFSLNRT